MEHVLKVKGSKGNIYDVTVQFEDDEIWAKCTCKAGIFGNLCKHILGVLSGDDSLLRNKEQVHDLNRLVIIVKNTPLHESLQQWRESSHTYEQAKKQVEKAKVKLKKQILILRDI